MSQLSIKIVRITFDAFWQHCFIAGFYYPRCSLSRNGVKDSVNEISCLRWNILVVQQ